MHLYDFKPHTQKTLQIRLERLGQVQRLSTRQAGAIGRYWSDRGSRRLIDEVPEHCYGWSIALKSQARWVYGLLWRSSAKPFSRGLGWGTTRGANAQSGP